MRALALLPCEKIIRDAVGGPSLIATFQEINFQFPLNVKLPTNAVVPKEWAIFAVWQISDTEMQNAYSQHLEINWPDGSAFVKQALTVAADKPDWITAIMNIGVFPAGQPGKLAIRVWMESDGERIGDAVETFVKVNHDVLAEIISPSANINP